MRCNSQEIAEKYKITVLAHYTAQQDIYLTLTEKYIIADEVNMDGVEDLGNIFGNQQEVVGVLLVDDHADKNADELGVMIVALRAAKDTVRAEKDVVVIELDMALAEIQLLKNGKTGS